MTIIDGGTASGTFSIDSDTAEPTDFDIMTTTGSVYTGVNYSPLNSSHGKEPYGQNSFYFFNSGSNRIINFAFRIPLSNSASTVDLDDETSYESITNGPNRSVVGGSAVSMSAIPEPETYALLLAGLGASGFIARRRKSL